MPCEVVVVFSWLCFGHSCLTYCVQSRVANRIEVVQRNWIGFWDRRVYARSMGHENQRIKDFSPRLVSTQTFTGRQHNAEPPANGFVTHGCFGFFRCHRSFISTTATKRANDAKTLIQIAILISS